MLAEVRLGILVRGETAQVVGRQFPEVVIYHLIPGLAHVRLHGREPPLRPGGVLVEEQPPVEPEGRAVHVEVEELRAAHCVQVRGRGCDF